MKPLDRYSLNINGRCAAASALWMGVYFFLNVVYYLGLGHAFGMSGGDLFVHMILPLVLSGAYVILLKGVRLNLPAVYLAMGFLLSLLTVIGHFGTNVGQGILGLVWLVAAVAVSGCVLTGVLGSKWYMIAVFLVMPVYRGILVLSGLMPFSLKQLGVMLPECAQLGIFLSLAFLPGGLVPVQRRKK